MAKQKGIFVDGAIQKGVSREDAERIFALLEFFAGYGFNKSRITSYNVCYTKLLRICWAAD